MSRPVPNHNRLAWPPRDRGNPRKLARLAIISLWLSASFSPDGAAHGGEHGEHAAATRSPPQADLLFSSDHQGNSDIYLLRAGETTPVNLTNHPASDNWPVWSPDGNRIVFQSRRNGNLDVFSMNVDGTGLHQLTDDPAHDYVPSWSNDGKQVYFASWRKEGRDTQPRGRFYAMDAEGGDQERMAIEPPGTSGALAVSRDGSRLAYARQVADGRHFLRVVDTTSGAARDLGTGGGYAGSPAFSPDGRRLAYYVQAGDVSKIIATDLQSGRSIEVLSEGRAWYPQWSPDGRWLVVTVSSSPDDSDLDIAFLELENPGRKQIAFDTDGRAAEASWRPGAITE